MNIVICIKQILLNLTRWMVAFSGARPTSGQLQEGDHGDRPFCRHHPTRDQPADS